MSNVGRWGARSSLGATIRALEDLEGNRDGLWGNEDKSAGETGSFFDRQPLALRSSAALGVGLSRGDEVARLTAFRTNVESQWDQSAVSPGIEDQMAHGALYAVQKAIAMSRLGREPSEVRDLFLHSKGSVAGEAMAGRKLLAQHWAPVGKATGQVVVVSPGFQETWRNFVDIIQSLNEAGHDVLVFDPQWSQDSEGKAGGIDRGFGVTLDAGAALVEAQGIASNKYGENGSVIALGNSMGGGPGIASALTMADHGALTLDAGPVPQAVDAVLLSPFFAPTPSLLNGTLQAASTLPVINNFALPSAGVPVLTHDPEAAQLTAQDAVAADTRAQLSAMSAAGDDLEVVQQRLGEGLKPKGNFHVIHPTGDPVADPAASKQFADRVGGRFTSLELNDHVFQQNPAFRQMIVDAINTLGETKGASPELGRRR